MIAVHGLPETLVSDSATDFTNSEVLQQNGIQHVTSAAQHKMGLWKGLCKYVQEKRDVGDLKTKLAHFLSHYRNTSSTTGIKPAELLFKRQVYFYIIKLNHASHVQSKQLQQKDAHDQQVRQGERFGY